MKGDLQISSSEDTFRFISKSLSDIYDKIDKISEGVNILNNSIEELRSKLKTTTEDVTKKIYNLEGDNDNLRKLLIDKVMNLENTVIDDLKKALSKISVQDNQNFINDVRKLFREFKTISWLIEISSMGSFISNMYHKYNK